MNLNERLARKEIKINQKYQWLLQEWDKNGVQDIVEIIQNATSMQLPFRFYAYDESNHFLKFTDSLGNKASIKFDYNFNAISITTGKETKEYETIYSKDKEPYLELTNITVKLRNDRCICYDIIIEDTEHKLRIARSDGFGYDIVINIYSSPEADLINHVKEIVQNLSQSLSKQFKSAEDIFVALRDYRIFDNCVVYDILCDMYNSPSSKLVADNSGLISYELHRSLGRNISYEDDGSWSYSDDNLTIIYNSSSDRYNLELMYFTLEEQSHNIKAIVKKAHEKCKKLWDLKNEIFSALILQKQ